MGGAASQLALGGRVASSSSSNSCQRLRLSLPCPRSPLSGSSWLWFVDACAIIGSCCADWWRGLARQAWTEGGVRLKKCRMVRQRRSNLQRGLAGSRIRLAGYLRDIGDDVEVSLEDAGHLIDRRE